MSKIKDEGGAAFPIPGRPGMSLRDYFAAKAMAAIIQNHQYLGKHDREDVSEKAYSMADAMLTQRTKHEAESDG